MTELRKVPFGTDYWHVVDDDPDNKQIIGSLLKGNPVDWWNRKQQLPWRAEYAPHRGTVEDFRVGYFQHEHLAMEWLEKNVKGET